MNCFCVVRSDSFCLIVGFSNAFSVLILHVALILVIYVSLSCMNVMYMSDVMPGMVGFLFNSRICLNSVMFGSMSFRP